VLPSASSRFDNNLNIGRLPPMMKAAPGWLLILFALSLAINLWFAGTPDWSWLPAVLVGWYAADFLTGMTHLYMDYRICTPGIGLDRLFHYSGSRESDEYQSIRSHVLKKISPFERLVYDFKNHHPRPDALGRRSIGVQIGSTIIFVSLPFSVLLNALCVALPVPGWLVAGAIVVMLGGTLAQYFHGTLHRAENPWVVRAMRRMWLLMTPEDHALHHETLRRDFATNSGWSNPLVNAIFRLSFSRGWIDEQGLVPR
jgi:hypothetical protein